MKRKGKEDALSVYINFFKNNEHFQYLTITSIKTIFLEINCFARSSFKIQSVLVMFMN